MRALPARLIGVAALLQGVTPALENDYVRVSRDAAPCAAATAQCGDRVIVALGPMELRTRGSTKQLERGDVLVFAATDSYEQPKAGKYFEVVIKTNTPPIAVAETIIPPEKNDIVYDGNRFFVFNEHLKVGDTRARHSHNQRVVIQLNRTRLLQKPDGQPEVVRDIEPDGAAFNAPVIHTAKNVGTLPLNGIVIEFKKP